MEIAKLKERIDENMAAYRSRRAAAVALRSPYIWAAAVAFLNQADWYAKLLADRTGWFSAEPRTAPRRIVYSERLLAVSRGQTGSKGEPTWDSKRALHTCCKARTPWRHKLDCPYKKPSP